MNKASLFFIVIIISVLIAQAPPARCLDVPSENEWTGRLRDGTVIDASDLRRILREHEKWIKHAENALYALEEEKWDTVRKLRKAVDSGQITPADLSGADLRGADLTVVKLHTPFAGQIFGVADLSGADLRGAFFPASMRGQTGHVPCTTHSNYKKRGDCNENDDCHHQALQA